MSTGHSGEGERRHRIALAIRDWIHGTSLSQCNASADECPDWPLAYEVADLVGAALGPDHAQQELEGLGRKLPPIGTLMTYLHTVSDDTAVAFSAPMPPRILENAEKALSEAKRLVSSPAQEGQDPFIGPNATGTSLGAAPEPEAPGQEACPEAETESDAYFAPLPGEPCETCDGKGHYIVQSTRGPYETDDIECPTCKGKGTA